MLRSCRRPSLGGGKPPAALLGTLLLYLVWGELPRAPHHPGPLLPSSPTPLTGRRGRTATNFGVESTARDAFERNYQLIFVEDAMAGFRAEDHNFAIQRIFPRLGRVCSTGDVLNAWRASTA